MGHQQLERQYLLQGLHPKSYLEKNNRFQGKEDLQKEIWQLRKNEMFGVQND